MAKLGSTPEEKIYWATVFRMQDEEDRKYGKNEYTSKNCKFCKTPLIARHIAVHPEFDPLNKNSDFLKIWRMKIDKPDGLAFSDRTKREANMASGFKVPSKGLFKEIIDLPCCYDCTENIDDKYKISKFDVWMHNRRVEMPDILRLIAIILAFLLFLWFS